MANTSSGHAEDDWERCPADFRETYEYQAPLGVDGDVVITRIDTDIRDNAIVDFAVVHLTVLAGRKVRVASFDIEHDEFHMHLYGKAGGTEAKIDRVVFFVIDKPADIQDAYGRAQDLVVERYEENKRRWRHG